MCGILFLFMCGSNEFLCTSGGGMSYSNSILMRMVTHGVDIAAGQGLGGVAAHNCALQPGVSIPAVVHS